MEKVVKIEGQGLVEPSGAHAAGEADASVFVVTRSGELVEAADYVFEALAKGASGRGSNGGGDVQSGQIDDPARRTRKWAAPRVAMADLLLFYDVNVWHRRCVLLKALLVTGLGWQLVWGDEIIYDPRVDARVPDHPAARLLGRPNETVLETFDELIYRFVVDFYSQGNAYLEVARDRRGVPAWLWHAPARTMRRDARFQGYWQVKHLVERPFAGFGAAEPSHNEILHLYEYDPLDDYYGVPDWFAALSTMGLDRVILEYNLRLFANSLMAHLAVVVEGGRLSKEGREAVKQFIQDQAMGVSNAGRVLLIEDENDRVKVKFEKLNLEVKDLMTVKPQEFFRDVVVSAHGVPPRLLGIVSAGQLGGTGEIAGQLQIFRETVLRPGKRRLEQALGVLLEAVSPGVRVRFYEMDITELKADGEFFDKMIGRGVYKPEEAREMLDRLRA